jgi:hypothetical protein
MRIRRRTNFLWGFVLLAIAVIISVQSLGLIPPALYDLIVRAWPALLVLAGLWFLLRGRIPFAGAIALVISVALAAGVAAYAFSSRSGQLREDNQQQISQPIPANLSLLRVRVSAMSTDVELLRAVDASAGVNGTFIGSTESDIRVNYEEAEDASATLSVIETRSSPFPNLESVGRGRLRLELPPDIPLDVEFIGTDGDVSLNMSGTHLERMNLDLARGDALVTLPVYKPLFTEPGQSLGTLAARSGDLTLVIPDSVGGRFVLDRGGSGIDPDYDPSIYNFLFNTTLEARTIESADTIVQYNVVAPGGRIRLQVAGPNSATTPENSSS